MSEAKRIDDVVELVVELLAEFPEGLAGSALNAAIWQGAGASPEAIGYALGKATTLGLVTAVGGYDPRKPLRDHRFTLTEGASVSGWPAPPAVDQSGDHASE